MFEWECDPARDGRLTIAEYREQFREKVGRRAAISGHMGPKRGTAAIFTLDGGKRGKTARGRNLCIDFASVHSGETEIEWL